MNTHQLTRTFAVILLVVVLTSCSKNDNAHTTATIQVPPPPVQKLTVVHKPVLTSSTSPAIDATADPKKPLLIFHLEDGRTFRVGEDVPMSFSIANARLKGEGGGFRVRYIADDDDMVWLDSTDPFWLSGWISGKHTIRMELIGPDGWPYKNGNANIVTRQILVQ